MPSKRKTHREYIESLIKAGYDAADELIEVAKAKILKKGEEFDMTDDLAADKMKNAAAAKKLSIFDAFEILDKIKDQQKLLDEMDGKVVEEPKEKKNTSVGFAEDRAK